MFIWHIDGIDQRILMDFFMFHVKHFYWSQIFYKYMVVNYKLFLFSFVYCLAEISTKISKNENYNLWYSTQIIIILFIGIYNTIAKKA